MKTDLLDYSIVIPVHNGGTFFRKCLASLVALNFDPSKYEIIVVDNMSTDETMDIIRDANVTFLRETKFQSSYAARNTGIRAAKGNMIVFTDADCIAHPDWLNAIYRASGDHAVGCFAGEILSYEPHTAVERFSDSIGLLRQRGPLSGWHFKPYAQTANAAYRREVFDRIGLFDPTMKSGGDAAIAWRMLAATHYKIAFVPEAIVYHHHRSDVGSLWSQFRRYGTGKMSWALDQPEYAAPDIANLQEKIITLIDAHINTLEADDHTSETNHIFPLLRITTEMAHLAGYMEALLELISTGRPRSELPALAMERSRHCPICGSRAFVPGPFGRISKGLGPQCHSCGSLERHRALFTLCSALNPSTATDYRCLVLGEALPKQFTLFADITHVPATRTEFPEHVHGRFDIIICGMTAETELVERLNALQLRIRTGGLIVFFGPNISKEKRSRLDPSKDSPVVIGTDFGLLIAETLSTMAILTLVISDAGTSETIPFVVASTDIGSLDALANVLARSGAIATFSATNAVTIRHSL